MTMSYASAEDFARAHVGLEYTVTLPAGPRDVTVRGYVTNIRVTTGPHSLVVVERHDGRGTAPGPEEVMLQPSSNGRTTLVNLQTMLTAVAIPASQAAAVAQAVAKDPEAAFATAHAGAAAVGYPNAPNPFHGVVVGYSPGAAVVLATNNPQINTSWHNHWVRVAPTPTASMRYALVGACNLAVAPAPTVKTLPAMPPNPNGKDFTDYHLGDALTIPLNHQRVSVVVVGYNSTYDGLVVVSRQDGQGGAPDQDDVLLQQPINGKVVHVTVVDMVQAVLGTCPPLQPLAPTPPPAPAAAVATIDVDAWARQHAGEQYELKYSFWPRGRLVQGSFKGHVAGAATGQVGRNKGVRVVLMAFDDQLPGSIGLDPQILAAPGYNVAWNPGWPGRYARFVSRRVEDLEATGPLLVQKLPDVDQDLPLKPGRWGDGYVITPKKKVISHYPHTCRCGAKAYVAINGQRVDCSSASTTPCKFHSPA